MTTATRACLFWQITRNAVYMRGPSAFPGLPHGGLLLGYATRQPDGTWRVCDRTSKTRTTAVAASRDAARLQLERIGAAQQEAT